MNHGTYTYRSIGNSFIMCVTINSTIRSEGERKTIKSIRMKCISCLSVGKNLSIPCIHAEWQPLTTSLFTCTVSKVLVATLFTTCHFKVTRKLAHSPTSRRIPWPTNKCRCTRDFIAQIIYTMALVQNSKGKSYSENRVMRQMEKKVWITSM